MSWLLAAAVAIETQGALGYAEHLYAAGEYYRAAGEYHRFLYHLPTSPDAAKARWGLGRAYLRGGRYDEAIRTLGLVPAGSALAPYAHYALGQAYIAQGRPEAATRLLETLSGPLAAPASLQLGRLAAESFDWEAARLRFEAAGAPELASLALAQRDRRPYSPLLAGALSVVPGAGHLYLGRTDDALSAFMLPVGTALIAWYYFNREQTALGAGFAGLSAVFWGGGLYGAAREAVRANTQAVETDMATIRKAATLSDPTP